jgi:ankyrin repeat protein
MNALNPLAVEFVPAAPKHNQKKVNSEGKRNQCSRIGREKTKQPSSDTNSYLNGQPDQNSSRRIRRGKKGAHSSKPRLKDAAKTKLEVGIDDGASSQTSYLSVLQLNSESHDQMSTNRDFTNEPGWQQLRWKKTLPTSAIETSAATDQGTCENVDEANDCAPESKIAHLYRQTGDSDRLSEHWWTIASQYARTTAAKAESSSERHEAVGWHGILAPKNDSVYGGSEEERGFLHKDRAILAGKTKDTQEPEKELSVDTVWSAIKQNNSAYISSELKHWDWNVEFGDMNWTSLHWAARHGSSASFILVSGLPRVDVNRRDARKQTALHLVSSLSANKGDRKTEAWMGRLECGRILLKMGADVNCKDKSAQMPLHIAASFSTCAFGAQMIKLLTENRNCKVNSRDRNQNTGLHLAVKSAQSLVSVATISRRNCVEAIGLLIGAGADPFIPDAQGYDCLSLAAKFGDPVLLGAFCARNTHQRPKTSSPSRADKHSVHVPHIPLVEAARANSVECLELLLQQGVHVDETDALAGGTNWTSALMAACACGFADATALLLRHGASAMREDALGRSPLVCACVAGTLSCARLLLDHFPTCYRYVNTRGETALECMVRPSRYASLDDTEKRKLTVCLPLLFRRGAQVSAKFIGRLVIGTKLEPAQASSIFNFMSKRGEVDALTLALPSYLQLKSTGIESSANSSQDERNVLLVGIDGSTYGTRHLVTLESDILSKLVDLNQNQNSAGALRLDLPNHSLEVLQIFVHWCKFHSLERIMPTEFTALGDTLLQVFSFSHEFLCTHLMNVCAFRLLDLSIKSNKGLVVSLDLPSSSMESIFRGLIEQMALNPPFTLVSWLVKVTGKVHGESEGEIQAAWSEIAAPIQTESDLFHFLADTNPLPTNAIESLRREDCVTSRRSRLKTLLRQTFKKLSIYEPQSLFQLFNKFSAKCAPTYYPALQLVVNRLRLAASLFFNGPEKGLGTGADVELEIRDSTLGVSTVLVAHQSILVAHSAKFEANFHFVSRQRALESLPNDGKLRVIVHGSTVAFRAMLYFMYCGFLPPEHQREQTSENLVGEVETRENYLTDITVLADDYLVESLMKAVEIYLTQILCASNAARLFIVASSYNTLVKLKLKAALVLIQDMGKGKKNSNGNVGVDPFNQEGDDEFCIDVLESLTGVD